MSEKQKIINDAYFDKAGFGSKNSAPCRKHGRRTKP